MAVSYNYRLFGLSVESDIKLMAVSEFLNSPPADVLIKRSSHEELESLPHDGGRFLLGTVPDVGKFHFSEGKILRYVLLDDVSVDRVQTTLLGPLMAVLLRQRSLAVLHGSVIMHHGKAMIFVGPCGVGKTTMASLFYKAGAAVLADDIAAITIEPDRPPKVLPAFPHLRLRRRTYREVYQQNGLTSFLDSDYRHLQPVTEGFPSIPVEVASIYALRPGTQVEVMPLSGREAFGVLMQSSRAIPPLFSKEFKSINTKQCAFLANTLPVAEITRTDLFSDTEGLIAYLLKEYDSAPRFSG